MSSPETPRSTLQLVSRGQFSRLWLAGGISSLGDWVTLFAVLALGNNLGGTSGVAVPLLGRFLPAVLFGAVSGVIADRFDNRRVMLASDTARGILVLGLLFVDTLAELFVVTVVIEMFSLVRQPAREAAMAGIVSKDELMAANGVSVLGTYGSVPVAGLLWTLLTVFSFENTWRLGFVFDSATFFVSAILVMLLRLPPRHSIEEKRDGDWSLRDALGDFVDGLKYVIGHHKIRIPVFGTTGALLGGASLFVLGEPFSQQVLELGSRGFGIVGASLGLGTALGVGLGRLTERLNLELEFGFSLSLMLAGVGIVTVAFTDLLVTAALGAGVAGLGTGGAYVLGFTALHAAVDDDIRGRTFATLFTLSRMAVVVTLPVAPLIAAATDGRLEGQLSNGLRFALVASGVIVLTVGLMAAAATTVESRRVARAEG